MKDIKVLIEDIRKRRKLLSQDHPKYKDTITSIFKTIEDTIIHLTHPVNIEDLYFDENWLIRGGQHSVLYLEGHHPSDKDTLYISRYKKDGVEEYTISVSPVMVHVSESTVFCTDPNIEISVITDIGIVDKIKSVIIDVYKASLIYQQGLLRHDPIYP